MEQRTRKKIFHISMLITIIVAVIFAVGIIILKYHVEGEKDMPFNLSSIKIISSVEGIDQENAQEKWNMSINQNNDIYLYIEKNKNYNETEIIENIVLDNFTITRKKDIGTANIYMPSNNASYIFENSEEYKIQSIKVDGDLEQNIKDLKISNQGGIIVFRYANDNIGTYISNEDEEIKHNELLNKINMEESDFYTDISFDITINLSSKKSYKANITLNIEPKNFSEEGSSYQEINDLSNFIFKRL
jgi:hypothetical protein